MELCRVLFIYLPDPYLYQRRRKGGGCTLGCTPGTTLFISLLELPAWAGAPPGGVCPSDTHPLPGEHFPPSQQGRTCQAQLAGARPALEPAASPRSPGGGAGNPVPGWVHLWLLESSFLSSQLGVATHFRVSVPVCTRPGTVHPDVSSSSPSRASPQSLLLTCHLPVTQQRGTCSSARHTRDGAVRVRVPLGSGVELLTTPCGNQPHQPGPVCGAGPPPSGSDATRF